jgi:hypothetical protein
MLGMQYQASMDLQMLGYDKPMNVTGSTRISPEPKEKPCVPATDLSVYTADAQGAKIFYDTENGYKMNVSRFPDLETPVKNDFFCANQLYELELYKQRPEAGKIPAGSVARVVIHAPIPNTETLSLADYARRNLEYVEGMHKGKGNYGNPFDSTPIMQQPVNDEFEAISWKNIYTTEPTHVEGTTASKVYLLQKKGQIIKMELMAWDIPSFNKAVADFDETLKTLELTK